MLACTQAQSRSFLFDTCTTFMPGAHTCITTKNQAEFEIFKI